MQGLSCPCILGPDICNYAVGRVDFVAHALVFEALVEGKLETSPTPRASLGEDWSNSRATFRINEHVFNSFGGFFSGEPVLIHMTSHSIDTGEDVPVKCCPYHHDLTRLWTFM